MEDRWVLKSEVGGSGACSQRWVGTSCDQDGDRHLILYYLIKHFLFLIARENCGEGHFWDLTYFCTGHGGR